MLSVQLESIDAFRCHKHQFKILLVCLNDVPLVQNTLGKNLHSKVKIAFHRTSDEAELFSLPSLIIVWRI